MDSPLAYPRSSTASAIIGAVFAGRIRNGNRNFAASTVVAGLGIWLVLSPMIYDHQGGWLTGGVPLAGMHDGVLFVSGRDTTSR